MPQHGHHPAPDTRALPPEALPGGAGTVIGLDPDSAQGADALSQPAANLPVAERGRFAVGNAFFSQAWVSAPASVAARDGLGPLHGAVACQDCHVRDGRGHPPAADDPFPRAAVVRLATPGGGIDPVYGPQLQPLALPGHRPEAGLRLRWQETPYRLPDGTVVPLRAPRLELSGWGYGDPGALRAGLRVAPAMSGLGLLEAIPEAALRAWAAEQARRWPGLSGRLRDVGTPDAPRAGRFGWKAAQASVESQSMEAFAQDLGITSAAMPGDACTPAQAACRAAPQGGTPELEPRIAAAVVFYASHLALPARRDHARPEVRAGEALFAGLGCAGCHRPEWRTAATAASPALADQAIRPYTDLLLHDLGEGLADGGEPGADGREWRTAPLWGLGHALPVGGAQAGYLHDGRARTLAEAILWHGGEAAASRDAWAALPAARRRLLLRFLASL